jgi:hypothetical protein
MPDKRPLFPIFRTDFPINIGVGGPTDASFPLQRICCRHFAPVDGDLEVLRASASFLCQRFGELAYSEVVPIGCTVFNLNCQLYGPTVTRSEWIQPGEANFEVIVEESVLSLAIFQNFVYIILREILHTLRILGPLEKGVRETSV